MSETIFVIGAGGTGMRCLESMIHFCAAGRFSNKEIHMLALDTDLNNGNFSRVEQLYNLYKRLKGEHNPQSNTMFGAKIHFYKHSPDYSGGSNATGETKFTDMLLRRGNSKDNNDLSALFFTKDCCDFDLKQGYRAQTHLGSMLMYKAILDATRKDNQQKQANKPLHDFLMQLGTTGERKKCFVMGSVFGGTGASSIPVLPKAFEDAMKQQEGGEFKGLPVDWGAALFTEYFRFDLPDNDDGREKVIANSNCFGINSQVALTYYANDPMVRQSYRKFYVLGESDEQRQAEFGNSAIGGQDQKNPVHYLEMFATTAADSFFKDDEKDANDGSDPTYYSRTVNADYIDFLDVVGNNKNEQEQLATNLLTMLILASDTREIQVFSTDSFPKSRLPWKQWLWDAGLEDLQRYLKLYKEWSGQLWKSVQGADNLFFKSQFFTDNPGKELFSDYMDKPFSGKSRFRDKGYKKTGFIHKTAWDPFVTQCQKWETAPETLNDMSPAVQFVNGIRSILGKMYK